MPNLTTIGRKNDNRITVQFYFETGNSRTRVCQGFYLQTLCISHKAISTAGCNKDEHGAVNHEQCGSYE